MELCQTNGGKRGAGSLNGNGVSYVDDSPTSASVQTGKMKVFLSRVLRNFHAWLARLSARRRGELTPSPLCGGPNLFSAGTPLSLVLQSQVSYSTSQIDLSFDHHCSIVRDIRHLACVYPDDLPTVSRNGHLARSLVVTQHLLNVI